MDTGLSINDFALKMWNVKTDFEFYVKTHTYAQHILSKACEWKFPDKKIPKRMYDKMNKLSDIGWLKEDYYHNLEIMNYIRNLYAHNIEIKKEEILDHISKTKIILEHSLNFSKEPDGEIRYMNSLTNTLSHMNTSIIEETDLPKFS